eukprot:jgi/Ulvmu1/2291/UM013_0138.1
MTGTATAAHMLIYCPGLMQVWSDTGCKESQLLYDRPRNTTAQSPKRVRSMKREDLKHLVQLQLGWDKDLAEQVLAQVKQLALEDEGAEIDEIVQNYMADSPSCQEAVQAYVKALQNDFFGPGMKPLKRPDHESNAALSPPVRVKPSTAKPSTAKPKTKPAKSSSTASTTATPSGASSSSAVPSQSVTVRKGNVSRHAPKAVDPAQAALKHVNRKVFNCLSCGKVYDLREHDAAGIALMRNGGACTFCGSPLPEAAAAAAAAGSAADASGSSAPADAPPAHDAAPAEAEAAATAAADAARAREFADRLLEFDRTSAKRTEVIDDQGDYFEIDSNQWLDAGERAALRAQQAAREALEEERRARVTVTVDIVGREVVRVEKAALDERVGFVIDENRKKAAEAAAAARASMPQGGGTGAAAAEAAARGRSGSRGGAAAEAGRLREFRIRPNLPEGAAAPTFRPARRKGEGSAKAAAEAAAAEAAAEVKQGGKGGRQRKKKAELRAAGSGQEVEGMDPPQPAPRPDQRSGSAAGAKGSGRAAQCTEADEDDADGKERRAYRRGGARGSQLGEGSGRERGLKGIWQQRGSTQSKGRQVSRLQDDRNDDIFDRLVEDVEVLYGDTSAAEKVAGGCG